VAWVEARIAERKPQADTDDRKKSWLNPNPIVRKRAADREIKKVEGVMAD